MSDLVPKETIETIVGVLRHDTEHFGRAVSAEHTVYVLHSQQCFDQLSDLRDCEFSYALDNGIDPEEWAGMEDEAVVLRIDYGCLVPA